MNFPFFPTLSLFSLLVLVQVSADTVLLNNGKSFEGTVIYEDDTYYLVEIKISEGIKDEKKFLKTEIKSITKQSPDIRDFEELKKLAPAPDLLGLMEYEVRVKKFESFIKKYPTSPKLAEAKKMNDALFEELEVVRQGGIKFSGKMIPAADYLSNAYAYDESIAAHKINREIINANLLGAMRLFTDYEMNFSEGKARAELIPKIKQVLQVYKTNLSEGIEGYDALEKLRGVGLESMTPEDRERTERALDDQMKSLKERFNREKNMKGAWITPDENYKESMVEALRQVENEIKRLDSPPKNSTVVIVSREEAYRQAWEKLPNATAAQQKAILENLKRDRMPESYLVKLKERITPQQ
ncbi:MAG: PTPDL family protein [Akkermansiaceae bacterium]